MISFILDKDIHREQSSEEKHRGGIIVFSTEFNTIESNNNDVANRIRQIVTRLENQLNKKSFIHKLFHQTEECLCVYRIGNIFKGEYVDFFGKKYNNQSLTIEINGISSKSLLRFARMLVVKLSQEHC